MRRRARRPPLKRDPLDSDDLLIVNSLFLAAFVVVWQTPTPGVPVHFGIVYHLPDSSADVIAGSYLNTTFRVENRASGLPLHRPLHGTSSDGHLLDVVIDSENTEREFAESQYQVHLVPPVVTDATASILFWDGSVSAHILPSSHAPVETTGPSVLLPQARRLVRLALAEADADMVAQHDSLEFDRPYVTRLATAPGLEAIEYRVVFKQGARTTDDRASVFFLYSPAEHRVIFANFGHPEWGPDAEHVFAVSPRFFFTIEGDPHLYLLAVYYRAWESRGAWVVFDAREGRPLTQSLIPLGK